MRTTGFKVTKKTERTALLSSHRMHMLVTWVEPVVRMRVGSGQTVELISGGLCFLPFYSLTTIFT